jgi:signal peptidase I
MDSTREIVETIVFVVVLVLLLKSFVAEAFVIPTGSMAETLLGHQKFITCPECDLLFPVNASREADPPDGHVQPVRNCICPNCMKHIYLARPPEVAGAGAVVDPGYTSGDRVLVGKYLYDLFGVLPNRLDVVVFRYPGYSYEQGSGPRDDRDPDQPFPATGPFKGHVPINYIKRLIGLPGETIAICNGKLYVLSSEKGPKYDDFKNARSPEEKAMLWQKPFMHINDKDAVDLFCKGQFQILRKSPENILAMKRLVYDNDHPARDLARDPMYRRWKAEDEKTWVNDEANGFRHTPAPGEALSWLRYHHHLRGNPEDSFITPFMGYNTSEGGGGPSDWVGDLILECEVTADKPEGELVMELSKGPDRFQASWNLADGLCTVHRVTTDKETKGIRKEELDRKKTVVTRGSHRLRFANVDQNLTLWVDDKRVFENGVPYTVPGPPARDVVNDLQPASIGVKGAAVHVQHVRLDHDTYYDTAKRDNTCGQAVMTMYVQPDHFLCMGDNSFHSSDSRMWGLVPRRLMLGKAVAVYYPFYFPWWPLSSQANRVGLIH